MEQWAEIRRLGHVEGLSQREIDRRAGVHRDTIRRALASSEAASYGPRPRRASKLDPYLSEIERLLDDEPTLSGVRVREQIEQLGYRGGKTILVRDRAVVKPALKDLAGAGGVTGLGRQAGARAVRGHTVVARLYVGERPARASSGSCSGPPTAPPPVFAGSRQEPRSSPPA